MTDMEEQQATPPPPEQPAPAPAKKAAPCPPPKREEEASPGAPGWIVTFADMMSLLLCFFVLLLSFSTTDASKFRAAAESLREAFALSGGGSVNTDKKALGSITPNLMAQTKQKVEVDKTEERLKLAQNEIDEYIDKAGLADHVQTSIVGNRLKVVNSNPLNFPPGKAEMLESSQAYLDALLPVLKRFDFMIHVEGHTDDRPIETVEFKSNWELSAARAANFVRYLEENGANPEQLAVIGYGKHRPIAENATESDRAKNRRIEILLSPSNEGAIQAAAGIEALMQETSSLTGDE